MKAKPDLSAALAESAGTRRRSTPSAPQGDTERLVPYQLRMPATVDQQLKILAAEQGRKINDMMFEAMNDLFAKYGKPEIAPSKKRP